MQLYLVVVAGPDAGRCFSLENRQGLVIGRGPNSDTQINDPRVSRVHCRLELKGNQAWLLDAGGVGGTFVGGQRVERHALRPGDLFQVGDTTLRYQLTNHNDSPTAGPGAAPTGANASPAVLEKDLLGQLVGQYRLDELLHRSHAGVLFKAHDTKLARPAAVKVLTPDLSHSDEQQERFVRAMRTMLPIRHDHIVRLYNAGKSGPYCWAAMEFIDGESLDQVIDRIGISSMLDWQKAWRVAVHVGRALQAAHEERIVHRNLTPTNILRRHHDQVCLLGDLMLAKALDGAQARQITQPGQLVGDVAYMSPERIVDSTSVDERSDLYGLGATLYALLTGRPPFEADTLSELLRLVRHETPASPRTFQLAVNEMFEGLVLTLLAKRPADRYQSATELLQELERIGHYANLSPD